MFWQKKPRAGREDPALPEMAPAPLEKTAAEALHEAATSLANSLRAYSKAASDASLAEPAEETRAAHAKLAAARDLVTEGRLAYALGRCLPEHVKYWPSWIKRGDFEKHVGFSATEVAATEVEEEDGSRRIKVKTIDFTFNNARYRLILRDRGMSHAPGDPVRLGVVDLHVEAARVASFEILEDLSKDFSEWGFSDVRALSVGPWMKDVLDMAAQIEASDRRYRDAFHDKRAIEAGSEIDLG